MPITRSKLSSVASRISARTLGATPALFTSTSSRPKRSRTPSTIACRSAGLGDVAPAVDDRRAALLERGDRVGHLRRVANAVDRQIEPAVGQALGDPAANPAAAAGHQRHSFALFRHV